MPETAIKLRRSITWLQGTALTVGAVLGSGVLVLPVAAAELAGPASLVSWLLMGLLAVPLALTLGTLASTYPDAGGIAAYARRAFGPTAGVVTGWLFLGTVPIGAPIVALIGANYIGLLFSLTSFQITLLAAVMLTMALWFNYRGIDLSGSVQVAVIATIAVILLAAVFAALPQVEAKAFVPFAPNGWLPVGVSMTILFWAFVGWEMVIHLAEEFKNPSRDIKISLGASLAVINLLYFLVAFVTVGTSAYIGPANVAALAKMLAKGWGQWAGIITAILGFVVCYGTIHTYIAGFSRLVYAQARQGDFPYFFAGLHPRFQTPHYVLLTLTPIFGLVILLNYWLNFDLSDLMRWPSTIFIALYIIAMTAALKLLKSKVIGRFYAMVSLMLCLGVYTFTGLVGLYPLVLAAIGWLTTQSFKRSSK